MGFSVSGCIVNIGVTGDIAELATEEMWHVYSKCMTLRKILHCVYVMFRLW